VPTFATGRGCKLVVDGNEFEQWFRGVDSDLNCDVLEADMFGNNGWKSYVSGLKGGMLALDGLWTGEANGADDYLRGVLGDDNGGLTAVAPMGFGVGKPVLAAQYLESKWDVKVPASQLIQLTVEFTVEQGVRPALSLHDLVAETVTGTGTAVDNTTSSTAGGICQLHVTANTLTGTATIKVQHSADNVTFVDLVTYTVVASATTTAERKTVASGTTINRYTRSSRTLVGTGSITFTNLISRN
jgi:hypothetical protein